MRPPGEIREALRQVLPALAGESGALTWRDLVPHVPGVNPASPADVRLVKKTVENMAQAGELERTGQVRVNGACRPMVTYRPRSAGGWVTQGTQMLEGVLRGWRIT